jgi:ribulose-phosphate 3-epimerase
LILLDNDRSFTFGDFLGTGTLQLEVGVKTDPIEYRYSFDWLFRILAEEKIRHVQLGTFFEIYQLPDEYFRDLRRRAEDHGLSITSIFTAHRELGGFFRDDGPGWETVARKNFQRLLEIGALVGASAVGSNPGAVLRDRMGTKPTGLATYMKHFKELMHVAADLGIEWLTIEPMSCLAEPPTLPSEMQSLGAELAAYHAAHPKNTAKPGYCVDVAHGYADASKKIIFDNMQLLEAALPHTCEIHLKNTDKLFNSTFGFSPAEQERGIVKVPDVRDFLLARAAALPVQTLIGYLEIGGPKTGRDYSDCELEQALRGSLRYIKETFPTRAAPTMVSVAPMATILSESSPRVGAAGGGPLLLAPAVRFAPSLMCADLLHFEDHVHRLESAGAQLLHFDLMDAHFAPNMPLGLANIEQLRPKTALPFDVHLMVENNDLFVEKLAAIGVQMISVHAESAVHLHRTLTRIRELGIKAGVALNPATPLSALEYVLDDLDFVLIMSVNPGFAGQKLVPSAIAKISHCRKLLGDRKIPIEIDGNVSFENIPKMVAAGADILVAGTSSIFHGGGSLAENSRKISQAIASGLALRGASA